LKDAALPSPDEWINFVTRKCSRGLEEHPELSRSSARTTGWNQEFIHSWIGGARFRRKIFSNWEKKWNVGSVIGKDGGKVTVNEIFAGTL
jgi:hypothetical protein